MTNDNRINVLTQDIYIDRTANALVEIYGERWAISAQHENDGSSWSRATCIDGAKTPRNRWQRKTAHKLAESLGAWMLGL